MTFLSRRTTLLPKLLALGALAACALPLDADPTRDESTTARPVLPEGPAQAKNGALPGASYLWVDRTEVFVPRILSAFADQPSRNRLLVYGGWQENGVRFDTWEWDGNGWLRRRPLHDPGARVGATAVYDEVRRRVLLTGGATEFLPSLTFDSAQSTWEWDGQDWTELSVLNAPPPRAGAASAWDPQGQRMLVFGGFAPVGSGPKPAEAPGTGDMWSFDGTRWTEIPRTEPWPPSNGFGSMTWDRARNRLVLLTGFRDLSFQDGIPSFGSNEDGSRNYEPINDSWEWDGQTWTQTMARGGRGFLAAGGSVFYDPVQQNVGMVVTEFDLAGRSVKQSYRRYEGGVWPLISYAPAGTLRLVTNTAWSSADGAAFTFGGAKIANETFQLTTEIAVDEGTVGTAWNMQPFPVQMPALTDAASITLNDGSTILFSGKSGTVYTNTGYRWTGGRWTLVESRGDVPSPRSGASFARQDDGAVLFGGEDDDGMLGDTYTLNSDAVWTARALSGPSARRRAPLFRVGNALYLFGGEAESGASNQTWRYASGAWTAVALDPNPGSRSRPCAASLGGSAKALLVGDGADGDVWSFDGDWTLEAPKTGIGIREGCAATYMSSVGQFLVVGGGGAPGTQDLWSLSPTMDLIVNAQNIEPRGERPARRRGAVFVDNPRTGGAMLFGGTRNDTAGELADTWQLKVLGQACSDTAACGSGAYCTDGACCEAAQCGPCGTCAVGGTCTPRPTGPVPGCDGDFACNDDGHCRLAPGQICKDSAACASGTCIKADGGDTGICCGAEGCAVTCLDERTLRDPEGKLTDCAPYKCAANQCTLACASVADCTDGTICSDEGRCVAPVDGASQESSCGCKVAGVNVGSRMPWIAALSLLGLGRRYSARRRNLAR